MDIEFIELEHRESVMKLMEICGIDMKEAYDLYTAAGFNFEAAINRHFNPVQDVPDIPPEIPPQQNFQPYDPHLAYQQGGFQPGAFYEEDDIEYEQFKEFKRNGKPFDRKYPVKPKESYLKSFIPKFLKGEEDNSFKTALEKFISKRVNIKTDNTNLSESFHWCWKEKFPIAIILLDFKEHSAPAVKKLFSDDLLIEKVLSQQFKPHGVNTNDYVLEEELKPFFNLQRDANSIVICRVNHLDEINVVTRIKIDENLDDIRRQIKQAKSSCIQNELDESHILKQFHEELRGNFNYQRPKTIKESIKMREDKKLRRQQEEEFFKACQPKGPKAKEQQRPVQDVKQPQPQQFAHKKEIKPEQIPVKKEPEPEPEPLPTVASEKVIKARQEKLGRLKKYTDGITFKIRLPSGSNIMVTVGKEESIRYLFDYIESQPDDLGFNNEGSRNFDIFIGFGGSETLKGKEQKKIQDIFEDSEVLIVREL